jgi:hypothetical protein
MKLGGPEPSARLPPAFSAKHPAEKPTALPAKLPEIARGASLQVAGFKTLALSLGLTQDRLSSSLLSFIKFFSLPLDPKLIQQLRQQVLSQGLPSPDKPSLRSGDRGTQSPAAPGRVEALAAAATAAAGKGLALSPEALVRYAAAIAGDEGDAGDGTGDGAEQGSGGQTEAGQEGSAGQRGGQSGGGEHAGDGPCPEDLRERASRIEGRLPLLGLLNKTPGRDGRRWICLPFSFSAGGVDCTVSLRILLADTNSLPWKAECLALDIRTGPQTARRWSFMLEQGNGASEGPAFARAIVGIDPRPGAETERNLRELMASVAKEVILRDMPEHSFPEASFFEEAQPR